MSSSCSSCDSGGQDSGGQGGTPSSMDMNAMMAQQDMAIAGSLGKIKKKILVMSGKGGVGKSTVSVNLALGLAKKGFKVGLMDVDIHGPDVCHMLGLSDKLDLDTIRDGVVPPMNYGDNLKIISIDYMMQNRDDPIIWRGPLKIQTIRQFIADIGWGDLDYLIIDSPPGTGDEPLSVAQTIKDTIAVVVTTPQEVALADVRKSINFCKQLKMQVAGLVENMSGFVCPHCGETVDIFTTGGGERTAKDFDIRFLGKIPLDTRVVMAGDNGKPYLTSGDESPACLAFSGILENFVKNVPLTQASQVSLDTAGCDCGGTCKPGACG
ncbi:MAG: Mrp/NBP35 family ATP-binding protein [Desulfobulbaceae bacterium]|nr:Mrp/NBP35 family ATP-binding protein [Desulfobulbaceae bacterium]